MMLWSKFGLFFLLLSVSICEPATLEKLEDVSWGQNESFPVGRTVNLSNEMKVNPLAKTLIVKPIYPDYSSEVCSFKQEYSEIYLTVLVSLITIGLTASLFVLTIIGWFPDMSTSSKHVCQAYSLLSNMVSTLAAGFVILSTFVPTANSCSVSLTIVHLSLFMFVSSDLIMHLDFYFAIVAPFWHEEVIAASETISPAVCGISIGISLITSLVLYFMGPFKCPDIRDPKSLTECPLVVIMNMTKDGSITTGINMCVASLFSLVLASSCHIFIIALQKLRANAVAPAPGAAHSGDDEKSDSDQGAKFVAKSSHFTELKLALSGIRYGFGKSSPHERIVEGGVNESSSSTDSESPLTPASGIHEAKEKRKVQGPEAAERKLGKALTKSFRYNLVNIATYGLLLLPSLGNGLESYGYKNNFGSLDPLLGSEHGVFLASWLWKFVLLLFIGFRTLQPFVMAKTDKALRAKINIILSDDIEE